MQSQPLFWGFMRFQLMPVMDSSKFCGSLVVSNSQQWQKFSSASQLIALFPVEVTLVDMHSYTLMRMKLGSLQGSVKAPDYL